MLLSTRLTRGPVMQENASGVYKLFKIISELLYLSNVTVNVLNVKFQVKSFILDRIIGDANELSLRWIICNKWKLRLFGCGFGQTCFRRRFRSSGAITRWRRPDKFITMQVKKKKKIANIDSCGCIKIIRIKSIWTITSMHHRTGQTSRRCVLFTNKNKLTSFIMYISIEITHTLDFFQWVYSYLCLI